MSTLNEPGQLVAAILDELVTRIATAQPVQTTGQNLTTGIVVSRLALGESIDPEDFKQPWTPAVSFQEGAKAFVNNTPATGTSPNGTDPKFRREFQAAFNTAALVDTRLMITKDQSLATFPTGRHVTFDYEVILKSMQSVAAPSLAPAVKQKLDAALKVLNDFDENGVIIGKSAKFKKYERASQDYSDAKVEYGRQFDLLSNTPSWPIIATGLQHAVDTAWDDWKATDTDEIEAALATKESIGVAMQSEMIAKARKLFDQASVNLTGLPITTAYSSTFPSGWADPDNDDEGWTKLELAASDYKSHSASVSTSTYWSNWKQAGSSSSGSGGLVLGFAFVGSDSKSSHTSSSDAGNSTWGSHEFKNDASDMFVSLEYMRVRIERPWLVSDLFYFDNWYLVGSKKNAVSDGTANPDTNNQRILSLIPTQFLVVRNLKIHISETSSDGKFFKDTYKQVLSNSQGSGECVSGAAAMSIGPITFGGRGKRSSFSDSASSSTSTTTHARDDYGWKYKNGVLEIRGAQIVAWFSEIVPASPPLPDPGL